jgi:hypothetical protein
LCCRFELHAQPNRRNDVVWATSIDEVSPVQRPKHPLSVNVAGGVSRLDKTPLYVFDDNMDSQLYERILSNTLLPAGDRIFGHGEWLLVHDRDPKHTSRRVLTFLDERHPLHLTKQWPANSPDLNPVENTWSQLSVDVSKQHPKSASELRAAIRRAWRRLPQEPITNAIDSMPRRLKDVISNHGGHTAY